MKLLKLTQTLSRQAGQLTFASPVAYCYNPLDYAAKPCLRYLELAGEHPRQVLLLGMNPGPFGMAQTGVPFGEVAAVREWMGIYEPVGQPARVHPKRPVQGLDCPRSEVSGRRLWGWARERFETPARFFEQFFVWNYCPLVFMEESGRNLTPDKLPAEQRQALEAICDKALAQLLSLIQPQFAIGVGQFAQDRLEQVAATLPATVPRPTVGRILHPSPASPAANRGWAQAAENQLRQLGVEF